jgi:hypothetical protein
MNRKDLEGNGNGLMSGIMAAFFWKYLGNPYITRGKINTVYFNPETQCLCKYILCYKSRLTACYTQSLQYKFSQLYISLYQNGCVHVYGDRLSPG